MLNLNRTQTKLLLISLWTLANIVQAYFTELAHDEAYYWVYSEYLDIGYFDHPPMIAFMIKAGYLLFQNELGVRLMAILFSSATLLILDELTERKNFKLIFSIYVAFTCFHIYGFIATPDTPLIFFTALFFLAYKKYLSADSIKNVLLLSFTIAALLYSKYHGILILLFVILSNLKLFTKRSFYAIITVSVLVYLPHILWQVNNDYPSYQYHVQNRNQMPYKPMDTLNYIIGLILIVSPLLFPFVVKSFLTFKNTPASAIPGLNAKFKRALTFVITGFTVFFLFSTLNTRAEANWNIPILIPLAIILFWYAAHNSSARTWVFKLSVATLVIFSLVRLHLMIDLVPSFIKIKDEFHQNQSWAEDIEGLADGAPVVFSNSYQNASKHYFYSKKPSHSHNNAQYRRNQFDLWPLVDSLQGEKVLFVANWDSPRFDTMNTSKGVLRYEFLEHFHSMNNVKVLADKSPRTGLVGSEIEIPVTLINTTDKPIKFGEHDSDRSLMMVAIQHNQRSYSSSYTDMLRGKTLTDSLQLTISLEVPEIPSKYYFRVNLKTGALPETLNGDLIRLHAILE
ncbi:MAG: ArnT family glycosyltransferase [Flavobacteriales bacterium]